MGCCQTKAKTDVASVSRRSAAPNPEQKEENEDNVQKPVIIQPKMDTKNLATKPNKEKAEPVAYHTQLKVFEKKENEEKQEEKEFELNDEDEQLFAKNLTKTSTVDSNLRTLDTKAGAIPFGGSYLQSGQQSVHQSKDFGASQHDNEQMPSPFVQQQFIHKENKKPANMFQEPNYQNTLSNQNQNMKTIESRPSKKKALNKILDNPDDESDLSNSKLAIDVDLKKSNVPNDDDFDVINDDDLKKKKKSENVFEKSFSKRSQSQKSSRYGGGDEEEDENNFMEGRVRFINQD